ncbi:MAG: hypothetical protein JNK66_00825 [Chitinophagales bacterium]|nr:hypothetical protein [Chitinophagales bacterium]
MSKEFLRFAIVFVVVTTLLIALNLFAVPALPPLFQLRSGLLLLTLVSGVVFVSHLILLRSSQGKPNVFIRAFMGTMALKLLVYILIVAAFLVVKYDEPRAVILHFLVYYVCYTILETTLLLQNKTK